MVTAVPVSAAAYTKLRRLVITFRLLSRVAVVLLEATQGEGGVGFSLSHSLLYIYIYLGVQCQPRGFVKQAAGEYLTRIKIDLSPSSPPPFPLYSSSSPSLKVTFITEIVKEASRRCSTAINICAFLALIRENLISNVVETPL